MARGAQDCFTLDIGSLNRQVDEMKTLLAIPVFIAMIILVCITVGWETVKDLFGGNKK